MTVCLYKCLTAAGLQRHYARFTVMGIYRAAHLSTLRMDDYPNLGVCSMEDRARLYQLVQLVKSLDPTSLTYDDIGIYNESEYEGSDEIFPASNNSFSHYGNPNGVVRRDKNESGAFTGISNASHYRPKYARRRLDFSAENTNQRFCSQFEDPIHVYASPSRKDVPVHANGSATPIQLGRESRSTVECDLRQNSWLNERSCSCDPHNGDSIKLHITRGSSEFNSHIRLVPKNETFGKLNTSSAAVTSETFTNNPSAQKDRKSISSRKNCSIHVTKPIPTYEAKRTAGYNYGLPLSSPQAANRQVEGPRINVCVRKRPLTRAECRRGEADVVTTPSGECVVVHESKEAVDLKEYILQHRFHFDQVFGEESTNKEVYQKTAYPLVQHMLRGGKATCFAYGQTGAGKTYTMLGSSHGATGLYALAVQDIFTHLSATRASLRVYVSFFEIYCGHLYDLLEHRKRLFAREDGKKVVHISGLRDVRVDSVSSLLEVISQGTAERTQGMSGVNPLSSRSHALLQIQLRDLNQKMAGRMWFVDLAGSERASDANEPNKLSRMEGAEINQSLLALKECIRSLDKEESHTPFRQSKLTQVLKDSFVGDSMTCMIANISPGHSATEHTLNTLRYADRVKELRGQNGLIGRRRSNLAHSDKNYMSGSNKRNRRNVGTKNPKLGTQNKIFCPKTHTRPDIWDTVLCSTPKKTTCGEKTQSRNREDILLEHISPIRGLAQSEGKCLCKESEVRQDWMIENEQCSDIHSHCVKVKDTKAVGKMGQQSNGSVNGSDLTFSKRESGFYLREQENHQQTITGRRREELEWTEMRRQVKSCRETCGKEEGLNEREVHNGDNKEKVRHLRQYHQQLQQFLPSPTSSFVHPLSSSTCPPFSSSVQGSLLHSSHFLRSTLTDPCLEETSNVQTETSSNKPDNVAEGDECASEGKGMAEAAVKAAVRKEEMTLAERKGGEIRCCWVGSTETQSQHIPTNTEEHLSGCYDSEDKRDVDLKRLQTRDIAWSLEQGVSDYYRRNPQFDSPQLQAVAERPLSPVCEDTSQMSVLLQDNFSRDFSSGIMNPLPISQLDVAQQAPTASFLHKGNSNASICPFNSESAKGESWETDNVDDLAEDEHAELFLSPLELPYSKILQIHMSAESDTATTTVQHEQQKCIISTVSGRVGLSSIKVHDNYEKKELTLEKNVTASITKPKASSLIQGTDDFGSCSSHNTSEYVHNMDSKSLPNISKQQLKPQSGCLNSAQPNHCNSSKIAPETFSPADLVGEKSSNQQIKPTIHLFNIDGLDFARLCIIEAHLEQLKEMETICHKEGELLCQQHDMAFVEFVHKLAEILERKARCVHNMRAQLMAYLKTNHHSTQENYENAIM